MYTNEDGFGAGDVRMDNLEAPLISMQSNSAKASEQKQSDVGPCSTSTVRKEHSLGV